MHELKGVGRSTDYVTRVSVSILNVYIRCVEAVGP